MLTEQRKALHDIIAAEMHLPKNKVIWANQSAPRVQKPMATLQIMSRKGQALEEIRPSGKTGIYNIVTPSKAVLSVQYYGIAGEYAADVLEHLVMNLGKPSVVERCAECGLSFFDAEPVIDVTALLGNGQIYEPRAAVDIHFGYMYAAEDDLGAIEQVNIKGVITDGES